MYAEWAIRVAGGFNLLWATLHVFFPRILRWDHQLRTLSSMNRGGIRILNHCLTWFWLMLAYVYLFHTTAVATTALGSDILIGVCIFWAARILVLQPVYLGVRSRESIGMVTIYILGGLLPNIVATLRPSP
jgi:hypothetical protein